MPFICTFVSSNNFSAISFYIAYFTFQRLNTWFLINTESNGL
jgi:hypothetical protein